MESRAHLNLPNLQRSNRSASWALIFGMLAILSACGVVMAGAVGWVLAMALALVLIISSAHVSPALVLSGYKARPVTAHQAPGLVGVFQLLVKRAGLDHEPKLYYVPSKMLNAFAVGRGQEAAIAVTDGLLRRLSKRELAAVLAHELSHIRHDDLFVMGLADAFSRVTAVIGQVGTVMLLLAIPAAFMGVNFPWLGALVLVFAPGANALLQLALSRSREHEADYGAAQLTGDPEGLAMALKKVDQVQGNLFERVMLPGRRVPDPALLRTHPKIEERLARLQEQAQAGRQQPMHLPRVGPMISSVPRGVVLRTPRWHVSSFWY